MDHSLTSMELEILRECAGEIPARSWGGAVGVCLEILEGRGLTCRGVITDAGLEYLEEVKP